MRYPPRFASFLRARRAGREAPAVKRILEVNAAHPILARLQAVVERDAADPPHRRVRRAALRAGGARRGRPAPRPRGFQQAGRRPHGPGPLKPRRRAERGEPLVSRELISSDQDSYVARTAVLIYAGRLPK